MALGPVGLVVAAIAVGAERAWSRNRNPNRAAAARQDRAAEARAWLDRDAREQAAWRAARRQWWADGADPDTEPKRPGGRWRQAKRAYARATVAGTEFAHGFREGWQAADQVRQQGGSLRDIAKARPPRCPNCNRRLDLVPADHLDLCKPAASQPEAGDRHQERAFCGRCGRPGPWRNEGDGKALAADAERHRCPDGVKPPIDWDVEPATEAEQRAEDEADARDRDTENIDPNIQNDQGEPQMSNTDTKQTSGNGSAQPRGESNAAVTEAKLGAIRGTQEKISDAIDQLAAMRAELEQQVADANEFAEGTEQSAATRQALDAATALAAQLGQHLGQFSDTAEQAVEETSAAREGLRPVVEAEDALAQVGAGGQSVARATNA
jgi:hypothetical protein